MNTTDNVDFAMSHEWRNPPTRNVFLHKKPRNMFLLNVASKNSDRDKKNIHDRYDKN